MDSLKKKSILSCFDLTEFFHHFYNIEKKILRKKLVKMMLSNFSNFNFWKNPKLYLLFLHNLVISGPGKCKIWNLGIKISKLTKFELWEMIGKIAWKFIETYWVKLSSVHLWFRCQLILSQLGQTHCKITFLEGEHKISLNFATTWPNSLQNYLCIR